MTNGCQQLSHMRVVAVEESPWAAAVTEPQLGFVIVGVVREHPHNHGLVSARLLHNCPVRKATHLHADFVADVEHQILDWAYTTNRVEEGQFQLRQFLILLTVICRLRLCVAAAARPPPMFLGTHVD
eukprot:CAMPEP_0170579684 /NCGR_PEP_ID=MMETSP0224-20130122/6110_1 /TAXON_ID=285029 /ORGANISM="Togula jolla, Strain CCCM 725" /LENGTH=126 /DNA_ID=CAMNT_0010902715 /DNA_START=111 /DNA_END=491 /DNA_ORIENTATION=+